MRLRVWERAGCSSVCSLARNQSIYTAAASRCTSSGLPPGGRFGEHAPTSPPAPLAPGGDLREHCCFPSPSWEAFPALLFPVPSDAPSPTLPGPPSSRLAPPTQVHDHPASGPAPSPPSLERSLGSEKEPPRVKDPHRQLARSARDLQKGCGEVGVGAKTSEDVS